MLGLMVATVGMGFVLWHMWCFDRFGCLVFRRRDAFRWVILFIAFNGIMVFIKYEEYYAAVPVSASVTEIMPVPAAYHALAIAWALLLCFHAEETLYWSYLIRAIRRRDSRTWFRSRNFKVWIGCCVVLLGIMPGLAQIETTNIIKMEGNIFLGGSIFAVILFIASLWLVIVFPGFIAESARQGANSEVISRLQYLKELNAVRTLFRGVYAAALLSLSIDGQTKHQFLNTTPFWLDCLFVFGFFCVFTSTVISLLILLPRSMTSEAGLKPSAPVFVRQSSYLPHRHTQAPHTHKPPHSHIPMNNLGSGSRAGVGVGVGVGSLPLPKERVPSDSDVSTIINTPTHPPFSGPYKTSHCHGPTHSQSQSHVEAGRDDSDSLGWDFDALGEKLHLNDDTPRENRVSREVPESQIGLHLPFAAQPGSRRLREGEDVVVLDRVPSALENFRSPVDVAQPQRPVDLNIVVVTQTLVESE
ncbi:hypothetical protein EHS25_008713 [Saitozyma podzolica]|uniref:Uncharacterized protein n=1 Tax=Saitozyma podzolica TaxID=1890683 RepID=A0A427YME3_9TREE|nr:hypothetical protein EHS25_008713 [Saitozyma podzolica]